MSKTKQKRLTAYFLLLSMCGIPVFADTIPSTSVIPNEHGAYIYVDDSSADTSTYDIQNVSNWMDSEKGAVVVDTSDKTVILNTDGNSQVYSNNSSLSQGGAINNPLGGTVTVGNNANFTNNESKGLSYGGGAIHSDNQGTINIGNNATFSGNRIDSGSSAGGAIAAWGGSTLSLGTNSNFLNNGIDPAVDSSYSFGGALYLDTDWTQPATFSSGDNASFSGNRAGYGGAAYFGSTNAVFNGKATFSNNKAITGYGGAIYAFGGHAPSWAPEGYEGNLVGNSLSIKTADFSNNEAAGSGGAIFNYAQSSIDIGNTSAQSKFYKNESGGDGGAIYNSGYNGLIDDYSPATEADTAKVTLTNVLLDTNKAAGDGGAIYNVVADYIGDLDTDTLQAMGDVTVNKGTFKNNVAGGNGGAIYNTANVTINTGSSFTGNKATSGLGGAIYNAGNLVLNTSSGNNITFSNNSAGGSKNDIYLTTDSTMKVTGGGKVILNSGLKSGPAAVVLFDSGSPSSAEIEIIGDQTELVLGGSSDVDANISFTGNSKLTNNATTTLKGNIGVVGSGDASIVNNTNGNLTFANTSSVDGVDLTNNGTASIAGDFKNGEIVNNENSSLTISSTGSNVTDATITNNGSLTVSGNAKGSVTNNSSMTVASGGSYSGAFAQAAAASITVNGGGTFATDSVIDAGSLEILDGGIIGGDGYVTVTEDVTVSVYKAVFDSDGLRADGSIAGSGHIRSNAFNLANTNVAVADAIVSNLTLSGSTSNLVADSGSTVQIGKADGSVSNTVTLTNGVSTDSSYDINVNKNATLKLAPEKGQSITLNSNVTATDANAKVVVDEIDTNKGVGTVNIASDNSGFKGSYLQKMGTVILKSTAKFFGGSNVIEGGTLTVSTGASIDAAALDVKGGTVNIENGATILTSSPTGTIDVKGGTLNLKKGAVVDTDSITATKDDSGKYGTVNLYNIVDGTTTSVNPPQDEDENDIIFNAVIKATDIANGNDAVLNYLNENGIKTVSVNNGAGLGLFNGTLIEGELNATDGETYLILSDSKGVRDLTLGALNATSPGSGINADNIVLGDNTYLTYKDYAFIRDDSVVSLGDSAKLTFDNSATDVEYNPIIKSTYATSSINKKGSGKTEITTSLADYSGSVNVTGGGLDLSNTDDASFNKVSVTGSASKPSTLSLASNITANSVTTDNAVLNAVKDLTATNISLKNTTAVISGALTSTGTDVINNTKLNVLGSANLGATTVKGDATVVNLTQGAVINSLTVQDSGLIMSPADITVNGALVLGNATSDNPTFDLTSGGINTINAGTVTLNSNTNISIDADPRSKAIDSIVSSNNIVRPGSAQMIITGVKFTETPIDRNVLIDVTKLLNAPNVTPDMVTLATGTVVTDTEMGRYLLSATSSGTENKLRAKLLKINPQMYRGQVATSASYANQLIVNNLLLDHSNILANDLIAKGKFANKYAAISPIFGPYQYSKKEGNLWYKAYANFERISMTQGLHVGNNAYGSLIGADFPALELDNGWTIVPTGYIAYNGGHQTYSGVSMFQDGGQLGAMATAYKGDLITSLLAYGGGYHNHMSVPGPIGHGSDDTGNWFAGAASKTAYNIHLPASLILQPTALVSYNIFGKQHYHSDFGNMNMNAGLLNGINIAPGLNLILNKKTFSLYGTAQLVFNIMGDVSGKAGNVDLEDVRMKTTYFEYGLGAMKRFKDTFSGYLQFTIRNGYRTGIGFQGGLRWMVGKDNTDKSIKSDDKSKETNAKDKKTKEKKSKEKKLKTAG